LHKFLQIGKSMLRRLRLGRGLFHAAQLRDTAPQTPLMNIVNDLNFIKSEGYDNISCFFIKLSSPLLTPMISSLASVTLKLVFFPDNLKIAKVVPHF